MARNTKPGTLGAKRRNKRLIIAGSIVGGILLLFLTLIGLSYHNAFTVSAVTVSGNASVSVGEVAATAAEVTTGRYAGVVPKAGIFFYPTGTLEELLLSRYMRFREADVFRTGLSSVRIEVKERKPDMLVCAGEECAFSDDSGFIYGPAPVFSGYPFTLWQTETLQMATTVSPYFNSARTLTRALVSRGLAPQLLDEGEAGDLSIAFAENFVLKVNLKQPVEEILKNFDTVLKNGGSSIRTSENEFLIEYIDLRFGNKVFYKPREAGQ